MMSSSDRTNELQKRISTNYCNVEEASHSAMAIIVLQSSSTACIHCVYKKGGTRNLYKVALEQRETCLIHATIYSSTTSGSSAFAHAHQ